MLTQIKKKAKKRTLIKIRKLLLTQPVGWCNKGRRYSVTRRNSNKKNATQERCLHFAWFAVRFKHDVNISAVWTPLCSAKWVPRGQAHHSSHSNMCPEVKTIQNSCKSWQQLKIFYGVLKYPSKRFPSSRYVTRTTIHLLRFIKGRQRPFRSLYVQR